MLVLGRTDLEKLLAPRDVADAIAAAFRRHAAGLTHVPERNVVPVTTDGVLLVMPAVTRAERSSDVSAGAKLVTWYGGNRARGVPTVFGTYVLLDGPTGRPIAIVEGTFLTGLRTGATSALAGRYLARPDSRRLVCFGAGVQAAFQVRCFAAELPITHVAVVGRDPERARAFVAAMRTELSATVELATDPRGAVARADVVTCATTSSDPVVFGVDVRPGTHVDAVGSFKPDMREVDGETVRRARVFVDTYSAGLEEPGDILIPMKEGVLRRESVAAELTELVTGTKPGRRTPEDITFFKSVGFALEDLAAAELAYRLARERGAGMEVSL